MHKSSPHSRGGDYIGCVHQEAGIMGGIFVFCHQEAGDQKLPGIVGSLGIVMEGLADHP